MLSLNSFISTSNSFAELAPVVRLLREDISIFGGRYIYAPGYKGELHIDSLANRIIEIAFRNFDFAEEDRGLGYEMANITNRLYRENDLRRDHLNFFSKMLCNIRDFWNTYLAYFGNIGDRYMWDMHNQAPYELFGWYTREQYEVRFGHPPLNPPTSVIQSLQLPLWGPFGQAVGDDGQRL